MGPKPWKMTQNPLKQAQLGAKRPHRSSKWPQTPQISSKWPQQPPQTLENGTEMAPKPLKIGQNGPKTLVNDPKPPQNRPKWSQNP